MELISEQMIPIIIITTVVAFFGIVARVLDCQDISQRDKEIYLCECNKLFAEQYPGLTHERQIELIRHYLKGNGIVEIDLEIGHGIDELMHVTVMFKVIDLESNNLTIIDIDDHMILEYKKDVSIA